MSIYNQSSYRSTLSENNSEHDPVLLPIKQGWISKLFYAINIGFLISTVYVWAYTFGLAYMSPSKSVTITINTFKEANLELGMALYMVFIGMPFVIKWAYRGWKQS